MKRFPIAAVMIAVVCVTAPAQTTARVTPPANAAALGDFPVVEFRRYTVRPGERTHFANYFESFFPEAFEQLGAIAAGSFFNTNDDVGFTWIRGFHNIEARAIGNAAFYYGPLWREHKATLNDLITDSDNVLLLRALTPDRPIAIFPAVDPVTETTGAQGLVVAQIFAVKSGSVDSLARLAEPAFAAYRSTGAHEAGVLVTLDVPNNFPQLPVRTDGPYLVWLGVVKDSTMLRTGLAPAAARGAQMLVATGLVRGVPETLVLRPTPRSRLRWLAEPRK